MLSRRETLRGGTAAVAAIAGTGALAARAAVDPDADLLRLTAAFQKVYSQFIAADNAFHVQRDKIKGLPDYPDIGASHEEHFAFLDAHGDREPYSAMCEACQEMVNTAVSVFEIPARTLRGALEKLKIVSIAVGDGIESGDGDLNIHQPDDQAWIDLVIDDLERLAGEASS